MYRKISEHCRKLEAYFKDAQGLQRYNQCESRFITLTCTWVSSSAAVLLILSGLLLLQLCMYSSLGLGGIPTQDPPALTFYATCLLYGPTTRFYTQGPYLIRTTSQGVMYCSSCPSLSLHYSFKAIFVVHSTNPDG